jgi:two-component system C4-dicarboxylate transport sensor histidine kinase DctB
MTQVLLHLLRNAIAALQSAPWREIRLAYTRGEGRIMIIIHDSGPGLPANQLDAGSNPMLVPPSPRPGLGLSISRTILVQFNGTLKLRNADSGGAVVELDLPALQPASSAQENNLVPPLRPAPAGNWSVGEP